MALQEQTTDAPHILNDFNSRIRLLESKYNLFGERLLIINKNMIEEYKKTLGKQKAIEEEVRELRVRIEELKDTIKKISGHLKNFSNREDVKILEKYLNLWNPVNFVTEEDVQRIISENKK